MKLGIVGLPNVGKSTLFNALARTEVDAENYPFCTIDPNVGVVKVPDQRLWDLSGWVQAEETTPATVEFLDVAGLVRNAHQGEGLGNQFLAQIREVDAVCHVLRLFEDENVSHVEGELDPQRDREVVELEFAMADLEVIRRRREKIAREVEMGDDDAVAEDELLARLEERLSEGEFPDPDALDESDRELLGSVHLLTLKPVLYVLNVNEETLLDPTSNPVYERTVRAIEQQTPHAHVTICASLEQELAGMDPEEASLFLEEYGLEEPGLHRLVRAGYKLLGLRTFFTFNDNELRAWTVPGGSTAPEAAGRVHSDFQEGFIRADTVNFEEFKRHRSWVKAREAGAVRSEGKEYVVKDGDILLFQTDT